MRLEDADDPIGHATVTVFIHPFLLPILFMNDQKIIIILWKKIAKNSLFGQAVFAFQFLFPIAQLFANRLSTFSFLNRFRKQRNIEGSNDASSLFVVRSIQ